MTRAATYRLAAVGGGIAIGALMASCIHQPPGSDGGDGRRERVETEAEDSTLRGSPLQRGPLNALITSRKTPPLPKRIELLTNVELVAYLNSLAYKTEDVNTETVNAPCVFAGNPCPLGDSAHIFIQPEAGMNRVERSAVPENGMIVSRVINDAPAGHDESYFGYPAQRKTWWVVDWSGDSLRSRFFVRTYSVTGPAIRFVGSVHPFVRCDHPDAPSGLPARAKFYNCYRSGMDRSSRYGFMPRGTTGGGMANPSYFQLVSLRSSLPLLPERRPITVASAWVSCGSGCCATSPY